MPFWNIGSIRVSFPLENTRIKKEEWTGLLAKPKFKSSAPTQNNQEEYDDEDMEDVVSDARDYQNKTGSTEQIILNKPSQKQVKATMQICLFLNRDFIL